MKLLVANRGEVAIRVARAAAGLGIPSVAVASRDDHASLHATAAERTVELPGSGPAAYLDVEALLAAARDAGCDALHPGYGFLSERADLPRRCAEEGVVFVGPRSETLEALGDKQAARGLAARLGLPVLPAAAGPAEARALLAGLGPGGAVMIKAVHGGGGRGMRRVSDPQELDAAWERCASEARAAFGDGALYAERALDAARHVEVQLVGDGRGGVCHLGERECSLQRRHQKLVEIAPSPSVPPALRARLCEAAVRLGREVGLASLATVECLVDASPPSGGGEPDWFFLEVNPRLQVEHTVTEAVTGVDLVQAQLRIAAGATLEAAGLGADVSAEPRGVALQARILLETLAADGSVRPASGTLARYEPASGPGVRVDGYGMAGYVTSPRFDPLLAKLVVHAPDGGLEATVRRARRALAETRIEGVATNLSFLRALLAHPAVLANAVDTGFVDRHRVELAAAAAAFAPTERGPVAAPAVAPAGTEPVVAPAGTEPVVAPVLGTVVSLDVAAGDLVAAGAPVAVLEAMKMEHVAVAPRGGRVRALAVAVGETVAEGQPLLFVEPSEAAGAGAEAGTRAGQTPVDPAHVRPDLAEVHERHAAGLDAARPDAVARRRKTGQRTARENVADLTDPGSFVEYGPLVIAAQRRRRPVEELIRTTPADGLVGGLATVNAQLFGEDAARCAVLAYDYTVLAGTQGLQNHRKKDRLFDVVRRLRLPLVFFTEGGGGRPGDTDGTGVAGLDCWAFHDFGRLSGLVPLVGIASGRCFAGNAALLGCCDVVIATANATVGMGGPAMIEGGGLGRFRPEQVGPMAVQVGNGVVDVPVADEAEAVAVARRYLAYFQGALKEFEADDPRLLRGLVPENRLRVYDVRRVIATLADRDSLLELRRAFGPGMITALARVEGRPLGIVANDPAHLAGAIDAAGADKAARFLQLCDAFDLPVLFLCDTPGIMVGPEAEATGLVRHAARLFVTGASLSVPFFTIVLRKGYGLGAQAMAGGSFKAPLFTVAWPTGEFGGMGLEGAVKLGYRRELEAEPDAGRRQALFEAMVARAYEHGKALNTASHFEIDDVIDPADSRRWIVRALCSAPPPPPRTGRKRPCVDTW